MMDLVIDPAGQVRCLYGEALDLARLGDVSIWRASHVEPDDQGRWWADLTPTGGPMLGPYNTRSLALAAEVDWLLRYRLLAALPPQKSISPNYLSYGEDGHQGTDDKTDNGQDTCP